MKVKNRPTVRTTIRAFCSNCFGERNCKIKGYHEQRASEDNGHYQWCTKWYLLTCRGCDHVFAQSVSTNSENYQYYVDSWGNEVEENGETIETWPARSKRTVPDWFKHLTLNTDVEQTDELDSSLRELYRALDADLLVLSAIGIRTSFDIASEILGVDPNLPFSGKINSLIAGKHITEAERDSIDALVNAGSASAHRGWKPTLADLDVLMNALENFIYSSLILPSQKRAQAQRLAETKQNIPLKPKKLAKPTKTTK